MFCIKSYADIAFVQTTELHTRSWKHLAFVQRGILDEPRQQLGIRAVERLPFCTLGWVPEHEATLLLLLLNPTSKNDI